MDKVDAQVYAVTPHGHLKVTATVLLGAGVVDKVLVSPETPKQEGCAPARAPNRSNALG